MKVVLAEKPSVARDIAAAVGANIKRDGYFEGNDYAVTYAFGHLVTIAEPEEMNAAWGGPWRIAQLPMIPEQWKYQVVEKTKNQFNVIKRLFLDPKTTEIICATDAGREGEHIFRLIYKLSGSKKNVQRLWISSLTSDAIAQGMKKLRSSSDYDNLAHAATARAHADWIVGLNFTRAYTSINKQLCTIGRVQTPTLALITARQKAIDEFKPNNFFEILATFQPGFQARYITPGDEPQTRIQDEKVAKEIFDAIVPLDKGTVVSMETVEKKTKAPPLFDLLTLQKEANKRFGYTAQETLDIAQSLYEQYKLISYPRTESRHLASDMVQELPRILSSVLKQPTTTQAMRDALAAEGIVPGSITASLLKPRLDKAYVDDAKLTDHHAIIPTFNNVPPGLPEKQRNIYELVAKRFMAIFMPPEVRDETTLIIKLGEHSFRARGVIIKELGWTKIDPPKSKGKEDAKSKKKTKSSSDKEGKEGDGKEKDDGEDQQQLPPLAKGQSIDKMTQELKKGKTTAPKPYDDGTLLTAMKNAGKELDDEDLAAYMKQKGLGTPATRAAIIERLLKSGYIERQKKALAPTDKGKALIEQVHNDLKDVALTAAWEQSLADMQDGKLSQGKFETDISEFVRKILGQVTSYSGRFPGSDQSRQWSSNKSGGTAGNAAFNSFQARHGSNGNGSNGKGSNNNGYSSSASSNSSTGSASKAAAKKPPKSDTILGTCPKCGEGDVRKTPKGAGCSLWQDGCNFTIWRECFGKKLTDGQIRELVEKKRTKLIKGFKKKSGEGTYDARLMINEEFKVRLDFSEQQ